MHSKMTNFKNIVVSDATYQALKMLGKTGDSFNDVIEKLVRSKNGGAVSD